MKNLFDLLFKSWKSSLVGLLLLVASSLLAYVKMHEGDPFTKQYIINMLTYVGMAVWFLLKSDFKQIIEVVISHETGVPISPVALEAAHTAIPALAVAPLPVYQEPEVIAPAIEVVPSPDLPALSAAEVDALKSLLARIA